MAEKPSLEVLPSAGLEWVAGSAVVHQQCTLRNTDATHTVCFRVKTSRTNVSRYHVWPTRGIIRAYQTATVGITLVAGGAPAATGPWRDGFLIQAVWADGNLTTEEQVAAVWNPPPSKDRLSHYKFNSCVALQEDGGRQHIEEGTPPVCETSHDSRLADEKSQQSRQSSSKQMMTPEPEPEPEQKPGALAGGMSVVGQHGNQNEREEQGRSPKAGYSSHHFALPSEKANAERPPPAKSLDGQQATPKTKLDARCTKYPVPYRKQAIETVGEAKVVCTATRRKAEVFNAKLAVEYTTATTHKEEGAERRQTAPSGGRGAVQAGTHHFNRSVPVDASCTAATVTPRDFGQTSSAHTTVATQPTSMLPGACPGQCIDAHGRGSDRWGSVRSLKELAASYLSILVVLLLTLSATGAPLWSTSPLWWAPAVLPDLPRWLFTACSTGFLSVCVSHALSSEDPTNLRKLMMAFVLLRVLLCAGWIGNEVASNSAMQ